jgi:predicted metal-dependent enzyme (double-stranded beta helix superfamily)
MVSRASGSISLEEFILETMRRPKSELRLSDLEELFQRLHLPDELIDQHTHFTQDSYCRSLLCRTPRFDMLILGWRRGQLSTIHDHLESLNCTRVIRGRLQQRLFRAVDVDRQGKVKVELFEDEELRPGRCTRLDRGGIHQMGNLQSEDLVTLHVYSEPLSEITVYEPTAQTRSRLRLRYSLEDEFV